MMRPIHPYRVLSLVILSGALILAGCAQAVGSAGGSSAPASPVSPVSPASSTGTGGGCPDGVLQEQTVSLTERDNGRTVCLATGTHLEIYLQGTADDRWSNPVPDSTVLRPEASGKRALMVGVSAGFYVADHPGQARVTATRGSARFEVIVSVR